MQVLLDWQITVKKVQTFNISKQCFVHYISYFTKSSEKSFVVYSYTKSFTLKNNSKY